MIRKSLIALVRAWRAASSRGHGAVQDGKPEAKKWEVADPTGPTTTLAFDTNEGTWMNVDVSPDGTQVVFDLLGDIYLIPIAGSAAPARRLTSGPAFDMQPRFSPDGKRIAIASDRDGLWNIWTIDLEGKNARQISRERRWFVNSPTWSPDGAYIYARRHFVKERSLGAGEIWMYHTAGPSDGLQVTERDGWQKDAGEPDISPDGSTLYYSKDVTPGQTFEYNKDPNGTIYAIIRRDLTTGRERRAVSVQGGSVDAAGLARRQVARLRAPRASAELSLRPRSRVRPRSAGLRKHRQGSAGGLGHSRLYPQYAWTPDGKSIVIWGEGKLWRVDVASGKGQPIPFQARVEQTLNAGVRMPRAVHPAEFPVRMLRDVRVSPDGRLVVYSALGHLYVRALPSGEPKRLTPAAADGKDAYEFYPAFSRDGSGSSTRPGTTPTRACARDRSRTAPAAATSSRGRATTSSRRSRPTASSIVYRHAGGDSIRGPVLRRGRRESTSCRRPAARRCSRARAVRIRSSTTPARASTCARSATRSTRC